MKRSFSIVLFLLMTMGVGSLCAQQVDGSKGKPIDKGLKQKKVIPPTPKGGKTTTINATPVSVNMRRKEDAYNPERLIANAFPTVAKVVEDKVWNSVLDEKGELLGYVVFSSPASDSIQGYAGPTPLLIAFNTDKTIRSVQMLANSETPKFLKHVVASKLLESWNGLTVKKAKKKKVDTVSGATFTSKSVIESLQAILKEL